MLRIIAALTLALSIGCATTNGPAEPFVSELGSYSLEDAEEEFEALLQQLVMDDVSRAKLRQRFLELITDTAMQKEADEFGIQSVVVLAGSGGGVVARRGTSVGYASFAGGRSAVPVETESMVWGGVIGGGETHTAALVTRLVREEDIAGTFDVTLRTGALLDTSAGGAQGQSQSGSHRFWATIVSSGAEGAAGLGTGTLSFIE